MKKLELTPIVKLTTQEIVYNEIKKSILNGNFSTNEFYTEEKLAESLNTSRTPVRAALQDLLNEGIVEYVPRKGMKVREVTPQEQNELFMIRGAIETKFITIIVDQISDIDIEELTNIYNKQKELLDNGDAVGFIEEDLKFHSRIIDVGNYDIAKEVLLRMHNMSIIIGLKALKHEGRMKTVLAEHKQILQALKDRDRDKAAAYMKTHLETTNKVLRIIDSD